MTMIRIAMVLALVAGACGDDEAGNTAPADTTSSPADTTPPPTDSTPPADSSAPDTRPPAGPNVLSYAPSMIGSDSQPCVATCNRSVLAGVELELAVVYRDSKGVAKVDASIKFDIDADPAVAKLSALSTYTDESGVARVTLRTFDFAGTVQIGARASNDEDAGELDFVVVVDVPPDPILLASPEYIGSAGVAGFHLQLFLQDGGGSPSCAAVHPDAGGEHPTPDLTTGPYGFGQQAVFMDLPGLADAGQQAWTLQFIGPPGETPLAVGCADDVVVTSDGTAQKLIYVLDLPPRFKGTYDVLTRVDLMSGSEGTAIGNVLGNIVGIFVEPGATVLRWACGAADGGSLGRVCGALVNSSGDPTIIGSIVAEAANVAFLILMEKALGERVVVTGHTIGNLLRDMRFDSWLQLTAEPYVPRSGFQGAYFPHGATGEEWTHVRFRWPYASGCKPDDEECGWTKIPLTEVYGFNPTATPAVGVDADLNLHVDAHLVPGMTYGPLINAIVEQRLLRLIFGSQVETWDDLIASLLGDAQCLQYDDCCETFALKLEDDIPSWLLFLVPAACEAAIPAAARFIRDQIGDLDGAMTIGTPAATPCPSHDGNSDRWIESYGGRDVTCPWDLSFPTGQSVFYPDSDWSATAK